MANVYDQFDRPGGGNVYDQFDESPAGAKPTAADYLKGAASGVGGLVSGAGYLAEKVGATDVGGNLRLAGDTAQKAFLESMTPAGQRAAQSKVIEDDPGAAVPVKLGDRWGQALAMGAAQSAPTTVAAAVPGALLATGIRGIAGMAASRGIGGALAPLAAGTAAPAGGWTTNLAGNLAARAPGSIGFSAAEGVTAGASNAAQWKSDIEQKPADELRNSPSFVALAAQIGEPAARQQIAEQGASDILWKTALSTGLIGALTGGGALGSAFQRVTTGAKGGILGAIGRDAAKEAGQEIQQSGGERAIQNVATRDYLDPSQSITQGVLADALSGGAIGGVMGGVTGGGSHLAKGPLQKAAEAGAATSPADIRQGIPQGVPQNEGAPPTGIPAGNSATSSPQSPDSRQVSATSSPDGNTAGNAGNAGNAGIPFSPFSPHAGTQGAAGIAAAVQNAPTTSEGSRQTAEGLRKLPEQQNTPAAPGIPPAPVSTAAPSIPTNQAEPAGVPVSQPQEGTVPRGNETEITKPAAPGQQAQPAAVSGAAGAVGSTGAQPANAGTQPANAGTQPANTGPQPAPVPAPTGQDVNLQNRDRDRAPSIDQMRRIAKNPDYLRAGASRTPDSGAPMVFAVGDDAYRFVAPDAVGNADVAVMSDGQRVPFRYAVVNANAVQPSNFVDGRKNPEFLSSDPGTLKALNNGRAAGIREAHAIGTAAEYVAAMAWDTAAHGIDPGIIVNTPNAMLVRLYSEADNKPGMAARSQGQGLGMSPAELARQDAQMLDSSALELFRPGDVASADNRDFVRAFVGKMQQFGQDIAGMMTDGGMLAPAGRQRIQAALVHAAYGDVGLVSELFDSIDTDIKAIGEALKAVAGAWANMRDSARVGAIAPDVDITDSIVAAVRLIQKARRDRLSLFDLVNQIDIESGSAVDSRTVAALRLFYTGRYLTRAVGKESLTTDLQRYIDLAMATTAGTDMFGERADPAKLLQSITTKDQPDEGKQGSLALSGSPPVGTGAGGERPASPGQRGDEGGDASVQGGGQGGSQGSGNQDAVIVPPSAPAAEAEPKPASAAKQETPPADRPDLALRGQTPAEVAAAEAEAKAAADKEAKARQDAEKARKDAEDRAEIKRRSETAAESFELGGDAMANLSGQGDMFAGPPAAAAPSREPTSKTGELPKSPAAVELLENPEELPPEANAASDDLGALFDNELEAAFSKPKEEGNEPSSVGNSQRDREAADAQRGDADALSDERGREGAAPGSGVPVPDANRRGGRPGGPGVSGAGAASGGERGDQPVSGRKRPAGAANLPAGDNQRQGSAAVRPGGVAASGGESAAAAGGPAGGGVGPRSASEAGKSAAKNAGLALSDVAKGLNALFKPKPGRLGMGLPFDEDTYAAAKPYFQAGLAHVRQAGADIVDMMRALIAALRDQFGMDKDTIAAMKPYVLRYISDVQAGREAIEETNPQQPPKDKLQQQQAAESIKVIVGDKANIDATLPFLTEGQREDVLFAEKRWAAPDGYGVLFTNGTGTGKTFLALGAIKRLTKRGKGNGIVVVPNEAVMHEWVKSAPTLGLQVKPLTDTKDAGSGIAITTYANFGQNDEIAKRDYDFVAIDEAHLLMLGKDAEPTKALDALRAVSLHPDGVLQRAEMQNRELVDRIRATSDQLTSLYRMMNNPDIMDQMYAAHRSEADGLEKKLAADRAKWDAALDAVESDVMARQGEKRTRAIFLSATPFAYEPSIQWGEGYLYEFEQVIGRGYNQPSGYQKFMMQHFGWRMRNGKLNKPPAEVDSDLMQRQFNTWLRKEGVLSARMLDVDFDYERKFILIQGGVGQTIDDGLRWLRETDNGRYWSLYHAINEQFDYLTRSRLLEAIKARAAIPYIKKHHALGRKVVVFYDFNSGGGINVFNLSEQLKRAEAAEKASDYSVDRDGVDVPVRGQGKVVLGQIKREKVPRSQLIREFMAARPELQSLDFRQYGSPLTTLLEAFPGAGVYNGMSQYKKTRVQSIRDFNDDAKPEANLLLVQKDANAGWSGHDTTGKHGRVLINLGLPVAPIEAIQEEGRIYRVGQKSDANFQYFNTGTNWERYAFGSKIARRAGTAENLAMGEQARGLREAFIQAFENSDPDYEPSDLDGRGGKAGDRDLVGAITEWDRARSLYFAQQKRTSRTKAAEGVDYYATPEPLGLKMVEWAGILTGESVLEPSAGHGAIARWFPEKSDRTVIEPSLELASRLTLATDAKLINERFEGHDTINKYDAIVMNPPFGTGGKTAIEHLDKAFRHLTDGGRVVALIPEGPTANRRFEDWLYGDKQVKAKPVANDVGAFGAVFMGDTVTVEVSGVAGIAGGVLGTGTVTGKVTGSREGKLFVKREGEAWATGYRADQIRAVQPTGARTTTVKSAPNAYLRASIGLPAVTFERAGTGVKTRVVIIDKIEGMRASRAVETQSTREIEAATVKDLFDRLENMEVVGRSLPAHKEQEKKQGQDRGAAKAATAGKADDVGLVQPEGSPATIEQLQKPEKAGGKTKLLTDAPRVKHVVASSGKELFGVIAMRLTRNEAKSVDPYSWPKDGGFFIRMEHVVRPASVAEQERAVYNVHEPDGITGDLFRGTTPDLFAGTDHALPAAARTNLHRERAAPERAARPAPRPAARVLAVRQAPDAPGLYHVSTQLVTVGERELPVERIRSTEDAAKAFAYLPRFAVEHYDAIVTDKDGKPLAIIGGFKGDIGSTNAPPSTLIGELSRIDGASRLWTAHNHPSGLAMLSAADRRLDEGLRNALSGSGVEYYGLFAMVGAGSRSGVVKYDHTQVGSGEVRRSRQPLVRVPIVERELTDRRDEVEKIDSPENAKSVVQQIAGDSAGLVFLDSQNGVAAFAPFSADEMGSLRVQGRLMRLFRAASKANARSAIMADPGGKLSPAQARNLRTAMANLDIGLLDVITYATRGGEGPAKSWMSGKEGLPGTNPGNVVFSAVSSGIAASPADRAVYSMAAEGKSADEILSFLAKASRRPFNRILATALQKAGLQTTVTADSQGGWSVGNRSYAQRYAAAYSPRSDKVALFTPRDAERHALHELVHAATLKAIEAGGLPAMRMRALFKHVKKSGKLNGQYGMTDIDEFVAEAFSNPRFQDALRGIPAPAGSTLKSAWQWFVRIVARIVGIRTQPSETALDRALTVGAQLMNENAALAGGRDAGGDTLYSDAGQPFDSTEVSETPLKPGTTTLMVDGTERSAMNSNGKPIHWSEEGVRNFWRWFSSSAVVDAQGRPLVVYHGTKGVFDVFDAKRQGQSDFGASGRGFYFSQDSGSANVYASLSSGDGSPNILPAYVNLMRPYELGAFIPQSETASLLLTNRVKTEGYDGVVVRGADGVLDEIVVFSPEQIKSATGNAGAFSPTDPDIRFNIAEEDVRTMSAGLSEDRIDRMFRNYAYTMNDRKTKAYLAWVSPDDFIKATTPADGIKRLESEKSALDLAQLQAETQDIQLIGEPSGNTWATTGHEGRHRMMALRDAGVDKVPVVFYAYGGQERDIISRVVVLPQNHYGQASASGFIARNLTPINYDNESRIRAEFGRDPDIRFNIATDWQQSPVAQEVAKAFKAAARSDAALSWLNPVQTQYHKAERLAQQGKFGFKRVFELGQKFLSDISRFAVMAENSAPTLFHQIRSLADAKQAAGAALRGDFGKQRNADIRAIAAPLYEGTLYGGGNPMAGMVWSDAQLRSRFGLTDRQIVLYHEAREAVKVSMDEMAKSLIARHAKREKVTSDTSGSLQDVAESVRDTLTLRADVLADEAQAEHDGTMQQVQDLLEAGRQDKRAADMQKEAEAKLESQKAEVARIRATVADVQAIADKAQKLQDAGYFPLMRFGRHTVTARDADGKVQHFSMHDGIPLVPRSGQAQANKLAAALREEHPDWDVKTGLMNPEKYKLYQGMNVDALQLFADHLDDETKQTYQDIIRLATNERSALRRMLKREGTPGFDRDVRRTLASFILSNARYTSSAYHLADMAKAAEQAEEDGGDVGAEAVKLYDYVTKPQEEAAKLRGFLFFNFLGGSLAAAMVNATQVPMMSFPRLAQYEDAGKLAARLARAAKMATGNPQDVAGEVGAALRMAEENGITAPHQIYEMTATAANNIFAGSMGGSALLRAWGAPFAMAESFNRRTTFIAAWQIGRGMTANQLRDAGASTAFEFAEKMVQETQGIYNRGNRVNIGRGAIGATVMTFRQFSIMYLEMFSRLPPKQKAIMAGMLILAAGAGGLPFAEDIEDIIDTIGQWLGYRTNTRRTIRRGLSAIAGQRAADIAMNGVLSQVGVDLHSRLGLHNILPGSALLKPSTTDKGREFQDLLGPAASVVAAMGQALQDLATGRPDKAALAMAPVAVQNAAKGIAMANTGRATDMRGKPTIPVSPIESLAKGVGFNPKSVADYGTIKRDSTQDDRLIDVTRERFTAAIVDAILADDPDARREALQDVVDWNKRNPDARIAINPAAVRKRVMDMRSEGPARVIKSLSPSLRQQARQEFADAQ